MISNTEFVVETFALAAVVVIFPFYLGFVHATPGGALLYGAAAAVAMAVGEVLIFPFAGSGGLRQFGMEIGLWGATVGGLGGASYVLALIFV